MYFDTHAHLDDKAFDEDRDELIASFSAVIFGEIQTLPPIFSKKTFKSSAEQLAPLPKR